MIVARTISEVRAHVAEWRSSGEVVGFVPTMGYLHAGHLSLIDEARRAGATRVVVSIFVNPAQFGPSEDLERYPRDEARDIANLESRRVDALFAPTPAEIYPDGFESRVEIGGVSAALEGERRPGHFSGVATVVLKLFNIVQPDLAVFGRKDAQQCAVVAQMVRDLDVPVRLVFGETVREADGLAMSSRNTYLDDDQRQIAVALHRSLTKGAEEAARGAGPDAIRSAMADELTKYPGAELDYLAVVDPVTFSTPVESAAEWLLAGAIRVGSTRLIDNVLVRRSAVLEENVR